MSELIQAQIKGLEASIKYAHSRHKRYPELAATVEIPAEIATILLMNYVSSFHRKNTRAAQTISVKEIEEAARKFQGKTNVDFSGISFLNGARWLAEKLGVTIVDSENEPK